MSYVVHVWAQPPGLPSPKDWTDSLRQRETLFEEGPRGQNPAFLSYGSALRGRYPSAQADGDGGVWLDGSEDGRTEDAVLSFGLVTDSPHFHEAYLFAIAEANALGLHFADDQTNAFFAADPLPQPARAAAQASAAEPRARILREPDGSLSLVTGPQDTRRQSPAVLRQRADRGDVEAQFDIGRRCQFPPMGEPDYEQAVHWYERSARGGSLEGAAAYGQCLLDGQGVPSNPTLALRWLEIAQRNGAAESQFHLARALMLGRSGASDEARAVELWTLAAAQAHPDAIFHLARCLDFGRGCPQDRIAAKALYLRARVLGSPLRAEGLRIAQREVDSVRELARRFEEAAEIPAIVAERRDLLGLLPRRSAAPRLMPSWMQPQAHASSAVWALAALALGAVGLPLALLVPDLGPAGIATVSAAVGAVASMGAWWGGWHLRLQGMARAGVTLLAAVPGLGVLVSLGLMWPLLRQRGAGIQPG
jgi:TPR repeat protein